MDFPVECPLCAKPNETTLEAIDSRSPIRCSSCGNTYAIGDAFERLYETERLVRDSVDTVTKYATYQRELKVSDNKAREATEQMLKHVVFEDLVRETARQILVHGDAFLRIVTEEKTVNWKLMPPARVVLKTSWARKTEWRSPALKEVEFVFAAPNGTTVLAPDDVIHFKRSLFSFEQVPYGVSMIQICLRHLHYLREYRRRPPPAESGFQSWADYLEESIILGLGVPKFVLEKNTGGLDARIAQFLLVSFVGLVNDLKEILSDGFDRALERFAKQERLKVVPKIEFRRLTERRVLIDCRFDFSKDVLALRALHQAGIINREELDRMLGDYSP